ncbi:Uncharacterized protein conserved in bacteria (DUF2313) [Thermoanaerobacter thermohydrosulfuricus WC1]|uniref:Uncharacterized protein conserved in bacteria (DUF2313) n=1 Tax=Thermoanaerobacter thermohydrosulfuricus WC1 TaxID=1198630 RepID=M8DDM7_THETY|nr:putative phage tail protein [Thermoanaerobacter thermohydrosulfuricus]EMT38142.1 Uncharacterized protein conserved in bacteria (DUF2313) [Thermoanaerobacter thermohydrosulfuricus WC1]
MSKERIMQYLPEYYQNSKVMGAIAEAQGTELDMLYTALDEVLNQFFIDTATWGLDYWDEFLGLKTVAYPLEERRRLLKSKLAMQPPVTRERLKKLLEDVADGADVIEHYGEYTFDVVLLVKTKLRTTFEKILEQIEDIKPAHLAYQVILGFLHELQATGIFNRWFSDVLKRCGTITISGEETITTLGRSYIDICTDTKQAYLSEPFPVASGQTLYLALGRSYADLLVDLKQAYFSVSFPVVSEQTFCSEVLYV